METVKMKMERLQEILREAGRVAVAFSGGVDSTFLLQAAADVLGKEQVTALTALSCMFPQRERREAEEFCKSRGIRQICFEAEEFSVPGFVQNPPDRCYLCKRSLFEKMFRLAAAHGTACLVEGSNMDDCGDYRPGLRAIRELGIRSPLQEAGLTKAEIRSLSQKQGLPVWNKPSYACLASRIAYGETITKEKLAMVEKAEQLLMNHGFRQMRVRLHGTMARIEVLPEEIARLAASPLREELAEKLKEYGFSYAALDLFGYRTGSMNETLARSASGIKSEEMREGV